MTIFFLFFTEACTVDEFYCELRGECMSIQVICDGVSDCYSNVDHNYTSIDESDCESKHNIALHVSIYSSNGIKYL